MKVTALETVRIAEFPNLLWTRVHTDEGAVGLGETFYGPGQRRRTSTRPSPRCCSARTRC